MTSAVVGTGILAPAFATGWLWAATLCTASACAVFAYLRHRLAPPLPQPAPSTGALRAESPAVVNMLTNDASVTAAALRATVIDLAGRGWLRILAPDHDSDELARVRPAARAYVGDALRPYEYLVLQFVISRFTGDRPIPARFLAVDTRGSWWRRFAALVADDARQAGLIERRWSRRDVIVPGALVALAALCCAVAWSNGDTNVAVVDSAFTRIVSGMVVVALVGLAAELLRLCVLRPDWTHTIRGLGAAERWLAVRQRLDDAGFADRAPSTIELGDRRLAYATAMCLADKALEELPMAREDPRRAWSTVGGRTRLVRVRYPFWPGYGTNPWVALGGGVAAWFIGVRLRRWSTDVARGDALAGVSERLPEIDWLVVDLAIVVTFLAYVPILVGLWIALCGAADGLSSVERTGFVIRSRRPAEVSPLPRRARRWLERGRYHAYIAVDDGSTDSVTAWKTNERHMAPQGARATVLATRLLGHVRRVVPVGHRPVG